MVSKGVCMFIIKEKSKNKAMRKQQFLIILLLMIIGILTFGRCLNNYFVSDDFDCLYHSISHSLLQYFDPTIKSFYRPMVFIILAILFSLFGLNPLGYHLISLSLHAVNACFIYYFVLKHTRFHNGIAFLSSLLFLVNGRHHETLWWATCIDNPATVFFYLIALLLLIFYRYDGSRRNYVMSITAFTLALLTKEFAISLPLVFILYDFILLDKNFKRSRKMSFYMKYIPYILILSSYLVLEYIPASHNAGTGFSRGGLTFKGLSIERIEEIMRYFVGMVPIRGYVFKMEEVGLIFFGSSILVLWMLLRIDDEKRRLALFGLLWFLVSVLPFVFFTYNGHRFFYLPSIGFSITLGVLIDFIFHQIKNGINIFLAGIITGVLIFALLATHYIFIIEKSKDWMQAAKIAKQILLETQKYYPQLPNGTLIYYIDLPDSINPSLYDDGALVFSNGNGITSALRLFYQNNTIGGARLDHRDVVGIDMLDNLPAGSHIFSCVKDETMGVKLIEVTEKYLPSI